MIERQELPVHKKRMFIVASGMGFKEEVQNAAVSTGVAFMPPPHLGAPFPGSLKAALWIRGIAPATVGQKHRIYATLTAIRPALFGMARAALGGQIGYCFKHQGDVCPVARVAPLALHTGKPTVDKGFQMKRKVGLGDIRQA